MRITCANVFVNLGQSQLKITIKNRLFIVKNNMCVVVYGWGLAYNVGVFFTTNPTE